MKSSFFETFPSIISANNEADPLANEISFRNDINAEDPSYLKIFPNPISYHSKDIQKEDNEDQNKPLPKRCKFSLQEDLLLLKYFQLYGKKWRFISTCISTRSPSKLKNRYYSYLRNQKVVDTLNLILVNLELVAKIEDYPNHELEKFQIFFTKQGLTNY